jgi:DNA alkylation repair enzyme
MQFKRIWPQRRIQESLPPRAGSSRPAPGSMVKGDLFRGIRVPVLRELSKKYAAIHLPEARQLLGSPHHEDRLLALLILVRLFAKAEETTRRKIHIFFTCNFFNMHISPA